MSNEHKPSAPLLWTREGFAGPASVVARSGVSTDYLSVQGPHAPRCAIMDLLIPSDSKDADALPTVVATSKVGVRLLTSARTSAMNFTVRNVEADELHFIQSGRVRFDTDVGSLIADEGDFVCIPRSIAYRYQPIGESMRSMIIESPNALALSTPSPLGMINTAKDVHFSKIDSAVQRNGAEKLVLKCADGDVTTFMMEHDPLAVAAQMSSSVPVFKLNLKNIQLHTYEPHGGPPSTFMSSRGGDVLMFQMSSRSGGRPPVHINADFDEVIFYVRGPGAYGACTKPGTLTWVPKGVLHHGPIENVPEGYQAWLMETKATLRFTPEALAVADLMETSGYGPHPSAKL